MGTFSQANIKTSDMDSVLAELKKHLTIDREIWLDTRKEWFYNLPHDDNASTEKNTTIILSKNLNKDWIEIEFDFNGNLYFYDEILRRISKSLDTEILLGYYQSTSGEARLAKFKKGLLELSFFERYFYYKSCEDDSYTTDRIYVADNLGVSNSNMEALRKVRLGEESKIINIDLIYDFFKTEAWTSDLHKDWDDWTYLHIELKR